MMGSMSANTITTCGTDGTIKFWNTPDVSQLADLSTATSQMTSGPVTAAAPYLAQDLQLMLWADDRSIVRIIKGPIPAESLDALNLSNTNLLDAEEQQPSAKTGIRTFAFSPDGDVMALGFRCGDVQIVQTSDWSVIASHEAHDDEIITMDVSRQNLVASAGRDRMVHIFDGRQGFERIASLSSHSSTISALKFSANGEVLITCGWDHVVTFYHIRVRLTAD